MEIISKNNILIWTLSSFDKLINDRQGPDIVQARKRITGRWSHNRFFNYDYEPSPEYFKHIIKHKIHNKKH